MCGIVGYVGEREAGPLLLEGLKRLEYRGYDSAGLAVLNGDRLQVRKQAGKIDGLQRRVSEEPVEGTVGIAHTRWATHGAPTTDNAHPLVDCSGEFAVIHNGIIENADVLRQKLEELGHAFRSETDTEVIAHLVEEAFDGNLEQALAAALTQVEGAYGLAVVSSHEPGKIVVARQGSPLLLGVSEDGDGQAFVASDVAAILGHTRDVIYLEDGELGVLTRDGYQMLDMAGWDADRPPQPIEKEVRRISWDLETIEKGGYEHFMLKEIHEQPSTVRDAMRGRLLEEEGTARLGGLNQISDALDGADRLIFTACGTSWHAGLVGEYMLEELAQIPVNVEYASEFRYRHAAVLPNSLFVTISQSGETADTLSAMREAHRRGADTLAVTNTVGSTLARESDHVLYIRSGPEIGVAATKTFSSQVAVLTLLLHRAVGAGCDRLTARVQ